MQGNCRRNFFRGGGKKMCLMRWEIKITCVKTLQQLSMQFFIIPTHIIKHFKDSINIFH